MSSRSSLHPFRCSSIIKYMLPIHRPLISLLVVISTVLALGILLPAQSLNSQNLAAPLDAPSQIGLLNTSALSLLATNLTAVWAQCNGRIFGTNLNTVSCSGVINSLSVDPSMYSWGTRYDGHVDPPYDRKLPFRWLSRKSWGLIETAALRSLQG